MIMKNLKLNLVLITLLIFSISNAQWIAKTTGTNDFLMGVHFPSASVGFVVGIGGTILKTTDLGETWNTVYSNTNISFKSVYFINESVGFAVGNNMLKTIDGGNSWLLFQPFITDIQEITFTTSQRGFLSTSTGLYKTIDGGETWTSTFSGPCISISFPSQNVGYLHGDSNSIFKTIDGGETWTLSTPNANPGNISIVSTLFFTAEDKGFFGGYYYGAFTKTLDGGATWNCINTDCQSDIGVGIRSIYFSSATIGYAVCQSQNNILKTVDGGENWTSQNIAEATLNDVFFIDENVGFVVGSSGEIFKTENGGSLGLPTLTSGAIKIYPNPIVNKLNIALEANFVLPLHFQLSAILGENLIDTDLLSVSNAIDLTSFSKGVYIYKLLNSNNEIIKVGKILKD